MSKFFFVEVIYVAHLSFVPQKWHSGSKLSYFSQLFSLFVEMTGEVPFWLLGRWVPTIWANHCAKRWKDFQRPTGCQSIDFEVKVTNNETLKRHTLFAANFCWDHILWGRHNILDSYTVCSLSIVAQNESGARRYWTTASLLKQFIPFLGMQSLSDDPHVDQGLDERK